MRNRLVSAALGIVGLIALGAPVAAAPEHGRVAEIAFGQCLEIIADMASELGEEPVELVRTGDRALCVSTRATVRDADLRSA